MQEFLDGIEWSLLRRQMMILQELAAEGDEDTQEHLDSLVATLHALQVAAGGMGYDVWEYTGA